MKEKAQETANTLSIELKLFRQEKEAELKQIIGEFVRIKKQSNLKLKEQWGHFLQKTDYNRD